MSGGRSSRGGQRYHRTPLGVGSGPSSQPQMMDSTVGVGQQCPELSPAHSNLIQCLPKDGVTVNLTLRFSHTRRT